MLSSVFAFRNSAMSADSDSPIPRLREKLAPASPADFTNLRLSIDAFFVPISGCAAEHLSLFQVPEAASRPGAGDACGHSPEYQPVHWQQPVPVKPAQDAAGSEDRTLQQGLLSRRPD